MKVILCEDVDNLGPIGETVNVAPGYARNFLLPRRLAVVADSASAKQIEHEMRIIRKREVKQNAELAKVANTLNGLKLEFTAKASAEGKLFGSITNHHIADKLKEAGHDVNRKRIHLGEPLKTLGDHSVAVRFSREVEVSITVTINAEAVMEEETPEATGTPDAIETPELSEMPAAPETGDE